MKKQLTLFNNPIEKTTIKETKKAIKIIKNIILPNLKELAEDFSELREDIEYFEKLLRKLKTGVEIND